MTDEPVHSLTDGVAPLATDELYLARSPFSSGDDRRLSIAALRGPATVNVRDYGAVGDVTTVGTGGTNDTAAFNAAIAALPTINSIPYGVIRIPAGIYRINGPLTDIGPFVGVQGDGASIYGYGTVLDYRGSGSCLYVHTPSGWDFGTYDVPTGGRFADFVIDGLSSTGSAIGFRAGDLNRLVLDNVTVENFIGSGQIGFEFYNDIWNCEETQANICSFGNETGIRLTCNASTAVENSNSFIRWNLVADIGGCAYGLTLDSGAILGGDISLVGLLTLCSQTSPHVIGLSGTHPVAGNSSSIDARLLNIEVEQTNDGSSHAHTTIDFGDSGVFVNAAGSLYFYSSSGTFEASTRWSVASDDFGSNFTFQGPVTGDDQLGSYVLPGDSPAATSSQLWNPIQRPLSNVQVLTAKTANSTYTPTANTTAIMVELIGGGGAGASNNGNANNKYAEGGGGGGAYVVYISNDLEDSYLYSCGAGGAAAANTNGGSGGNTIFGNSSNNCAYGNAGGGSGAAAAGNGTAAGGAAGGAGGTVHTGLWGLSGEPGGSAWKSNNAVGLQQGGDGGSAPRGGWGGRGGVSTFVSPGAGQNYGGGGGGAAGNNNVKAADGAQGVIIVTEFTG